MHAVFIDTTMTTPPTGGAHKFLLDLCAPMAARGWTLSFVAQPGPERGVVNALRAAGADVREHLWRATDLPEERAASLAAWVNSVRPDAYVISTSPDAGWLALPLLDASIPTVSVAHNDVGAYYEPLKHYGALVDCAVGVSEEIERRTVAECGVPPERARRIPYGVETLPEAEALARVEAAGKGPLKIGYVGRVVVEQKRVLEMAPLAAELARRGVEFELHVVGDGPARGSLEEEMHRLGVGGRVKLWGWLAPAEVRRRLSELDVFLLMSDYEGLSVALLEAMGHALAPVVTDIRSGTGEVVRDGRSGFLVPVGDVQTFADRLERLAREPSLLASLKRGAWEASRPFTVERTADAYVECFEAARAFSSRREAGVARRPGFPLMPSCRSRYPRWARKLKSYLLALPLGARASEEARGGPHLLEVSCIACGGRRLTDLGPLPNFTAGLQGEPAGEGGALSSLYACADCTLRFRVPVPTDEELMHYYGSLSEGECWQYEGEREVWRHVRAALAGAPGRTVLDVGCFRGDLLHFLGGEWERYGVEPSEEARRVARARGIEVIAESLDELRGDGRRFAAITLIDVIEHLPRPLEALDTLARLLEPGGRLVVFTGSTDAWSWRLAGTHYWYCAMPEHIAFFRPSWFRWAAPRLGCGLSALRRLAYSPANFPVRLDQSLKSVAYVGYHRLKEWPLLGRALPSLPVLGRVGAWESCWWTSARDHVLVTLTKKAVDDSR